MMPFGIISQSSNSGNIVKILRKYVEQQFHFYGVRFSIIWNILIFLHAKILMIMIMIVIIW